jgi:hypothetical protein
MQSYWRQPDLPSPQELVALNLLESRKIADVSENRQQCVQLLLVLQQTSQKIVGLLQKCIKDQAQISVSRSLRSPIRSLPVEILSYIFWMCIAFNDFVKRSVHPSPFLLGQVCKRWRDVVHNEPSLWTRTRVTVHHGPDGPGRDLLCKTLQVHRERAKKAALELSIGLPGAATLHSNLGIQFRAILGVIPQCKALQVSFNNDVTAALFSSLDPATFSLVEFLSFKFHVGTTPANNFSVAPRLRSVHIYATSSNLSSLSFPPQLKNLICHFDAHYYSRLPTIKGWRAFLVNYPNLQRIEVYFAGHGCCDGYVLFANPTDTLSPAVTFAEARSLFVRIGFRASLANIIANFSFPNLEELQLVAISNPVSLLNPDMPLIEMPFIFRLTSLRLIRVEISPSDLRDVLDAAQLLTSLDVLSGTFREARFEVDDDALVSHLTVKDNQMPILPRLRDLWLYLNISYELSEAGSMPPYADMATSRYKWALSHIHSRDANVDQDRLPANGLPSYPFRLHLKYEKENGHLMPSIAEAIGTTAFPVLFPEFSVSFAKDF